MALQLAIGSIVQSNDGTILTITDGTGAYNVTTNPTGWGTPNTALADINGSTSALTIQITVTDSGGTETVYTAVDFFDKNLAAPVTIDDLVFELTPADLVTSGGVAMGTDEDQFTNGWYDITYTIDHSLVGGTGTQYDLVTYKFVVGAVRSDIYSIFLAIPYHSVLAIPTKLYIHNAHDLIFPIYLASLYEGMNAFISESRKNEMLSQLQLLEDLTS